MTAPSTDMVAPPVSHLFDTLSDEARDERREAFVTDAFACMLHAALTARDAKVGITRFVARAHACGLMSVWHDDNGHHVAFLQLAASGETLTAALEEWLLRVGAGSRF